MISFIIPTRNEAKVLARTLQNLKRLSLSHEVIVSDGNSTDGTIGIAEQLADRVVVYREPKRQTIGQGRNLGAAVATGDFLLFMDADIEIPDSDHFLSSALDLFRADPKLVGIIPRVRVVPATENFGDRFLTWWVTMVCTIQNNWLGIGAGPGEFQLVRAESFRAVQGYDERLVASEDFDFMRRLARVGRTRYIHSLVAFQSGRRAHQTGWLKLWWIWNVNAVMALFFKRAVSREWKEVR